MRRGSARAGRALAACACACALLATLPAIALGAASYVVVYNGSVHDADAQTAALQSSYGFVARFRYSSALDGFAATLTDGQLQAIAHAPGVAYVAPDTTFTATGLTSLLTGETLPPGIRRVGAASLLQVHAASGAAVAVLDTGIDLANADLNAVSGINCVKSGTAQDDNGHGTNVAGIIAARDQGAGVAGVAPGTKLYAVKVLGANGSGTLSQILCGINWVTANASTLGIKVANMSLAGAGLNDGNCGHTNNDAEHQAICTSTAAGVTYVAAAGNNAAKFSTYIPAAYPEVLTATAMSDTDGLAGGLGPVPSCLNGQHDDAYATYSNYAASSTDQAHAIAAPGTCILSDKVGGGTSLYYGTSQAAPHVAAAVALCIDDGGVAGPCSGLAPARVITHVIGDASAAALTAGFTGDPLHPVTGKYYGYLVSASGY